MKLLLTLVLGLLGLAGTAAFPQACTTSSPAPVLSVGGDTDGSATGIEGDQPLTVSLPHHAPGRYKVYVRVDSAFVHRHLTRTVEVTHAGSSSQTLHVRVPSGQYRISAHAVGSDRQASAEARVRLDVASRSN